MVGFAYTSLNAVQQVQQAVSPVQVSPVVGGLGGLGASRGGSYTQLCVALSPLQVAHGLHVAKVGLGGVG